MKTMKKIIKVSAFLLLLALLPSCSKFNKSNFYDKAFGFNLTPEIADKKHEYTDGILIIRGIKNTDSILSKAFPGGFTNNPEYTPAFRDGKEIGNVSWGETRYKIWESCDGYFKMTVYYPKMQILVLGYFDGFGG